MKGLPKQFETFSIIAKFSRDEKSLDELKRDLVNFDSERQVIEKEHAFNSENRVCFKCHKRGHVSKQCRENLSSRRDSKDRVRKVQCYECKEFGHIAKYCQAKKKFISKTKREQQNLVAETEAHFSFLSGVSPGEDLFVDSGATSNMIKDRDMFVSLDENFKGSVSNANFSESKILGKSEVRFRVKDEKGEFKMIELKDTLYVPENSRNLLSVSKMKKGGAEVVFGASSFVRQGNGSVYPLREESGLFLWDTFVGKDECYVVSTLKQWHCRMGHNNYKDLSHLEQHVEGMKISDFKIENCETCELNKAKKKPVPKDFYTRATRTLDFVHTDILGPIDPLAEDGHRYAKVLWTVFLDI